MSIRAENKLAHIISNSKNFFFIDDVLHTLSTPTSAKRNVLLFCKKELEEVEKIYKSWKHKQTGEFKKLHSVTSVRFTSIRKFCLMLIRE